MGLIAQIPWKKAWEVVKRVGIWVGKAAKVVWETYKKAKPVIDEVEKISKKLREGRQVISNSLKPKKSDDSLSVTQRQEKYRLQQDTLEMVIWAQTINRFSNNIQLHAAQLSIHFESLKNTAALANVILLHHKTLEEVVTVINSNQRSSHKHIIDATQLGGAQITSFNIESQYNAFKRTQGLLEKECKDFVLALTQQTKKAQHVALVASHLLDKNDPLLRWVNNDVIRSLAKVKSKTIAMQDSLTSIPRLPLK